MTKSAKMKKCQRVYKKHVDKPKKPVDKSKKVDEKKKPLNSYQKFVKEECKKAKYKGLSPKERLTKIASAWKKAK